LAVVLAGILLGYVVQDGPSSRPAHAQTAGSSIDFAENSTAPVAKFLAYDQDGDDIAWTLGGPDDDLFTIDDGVLAFREPPNYEAPQSATSGVSLSERNVYQVTVKAGGGTHDVVVRVTDVDEAGTASIDRRQPQVSRPLSASMSDEDEGVSGQAWQWSRSEDKTTWTDIEGATSPRRSPEEEDEGKYLRATVTYSDKFGTGKTASAVSFRPVEARTLSNAAPRFVNRRGDEVTTMTLSVPENTDVGRPIRSRVSTRVSATDADGDLLFYELLDTPDLEDDEGVARFTIDSATGQIRVGKVLGADAREHLGGPDEREDEDGNNDYVLRVRASDPSTASATVDVVVRVTPVDEPPHFVDEDVPTVLRVRENEEPPDITLEDGGEIEGNPFAVADQDTANPTVSYSVTGDDEEYFEISDADGLTFAEDDDPETEDIVETHTPDYETKNSYSITITARSGSRSVSQDVTIEVVDTEDPGEVLLSQRQPQVGIEINAIPSDPDGGMRIDRWVWEHSAPITVADDGTRSAECWADPEDPNIVVIGDWTPIAEASSPAYTPTSADVGRCLRATVVYTDNIENPPNADDEATGVSEAPVQESRFANAAPTFVDQDLNSPGDQSDRTSRKIAENTDPEEPIGLPVSAFDEDDGLLIYTLDGVDAAFFDISREDGQLMTKASLNFEARNSYSVVVTATDPSGASDSIQVTINVTNVHDPVHITGVRSVRYAENGTEPVASYTAFDEAGHIIRWSVSGDDRDVFTIDDGVLRFTEPPNYEDPQSASTSSLLSSRNVYRVTVEAAGGTRSVTVTVTDVDEAGVVSIDRPQPQVGRPLSASLLDDDDMVDDQRWQWARSVDGRAWTNIEGATEPERRPAPEDVGRYLRATVTYSDKFGDGKTASAVTLNPVEATTLFDSAPRFVDRDGDDVTTVTRSVAEHTAVGMPIGEPVSATDADEDILFYELLDIPDLLETPDLNDDDGDARFTIDSLTGQIRVGKELDADPGKIEDEDSSALTDGFELPEGEDPRLEGNSEYVLRVRASDPSTASAIVYVIVRVTEVNEPPAFDDDAPTLLTVVENETPPVIKIGHDGGPIVGGTFPTGTYAVTDQDGEVTGPEGYDDTNYTYSVSGPDGDDFDFDDSGKLVFKTDHEPDFEDRSSYSITIVARSGGEGRELSAALDVVIDVVDGEDDGVVVLSQRQPEVGIAIQAIASDEDGGVTIRKWVWEQSEEVTVNERGVPSAECLEGSEVLVIDTVSDWTTIAGATSAVYAPKASDVGHCLRARAFYVDNVGRAVEEATGVLEVPVGRHVSFITAPESDGGFVNAAPVFPDQDYTTEGDQSDSAIREVAEDTGDNPETGRSIGAPVRAIDYDDDLLIYTLTGPDAEFFRIGRNDGQLTTETPLNFEVRNRYVVVVTATDPFGAMDSIQVTIHVTDEDDPAEITVNAGASARGP